MTEDLVQYCKDHNILRTNCSDLETLKKIQPVAEDASFPEKMYPLLTKRSATLADSVDKMVDYFENVSAAELEELAHRAGYDVEVVDRVSLKDTMYDALNGPGDCNDDSSVENFIKAAESLAPYFSKLG